MSYIAWQYAITSSSSPTSNKTEPLPPLPLTLAQLAHADLRKDVLPRMSVNEKIELLAGNGWWSTAAIPRVGIPAIKMSDGPNGVRGSSHFQPTTATCIPCATALAATFDTALIRSAGGLLARECKSKGSSLLLGPTVNVQRSPLNGRAFESLSEDPHLSGMIASALVNGLQENGVGAVMKHFVCNDMEDKRFSVSVEVGERALRETYLMPFMLTQKLAKPWAYMTAYSRLRGVHCAEHKELLQDVLRGEWGFDGMVMSDWFGTYSTDAAINNGLDLEMPGPTRWRGIQAQVSLNAGKIDLSAIDDRAFAVLQAVQRSILASPETVLHNQDLERSRNDPDDNALNRKLAAESMVLLKNSRKTLPLNKTKTRRVLVTGPNAKTRTVSGGGSAYLMSSYVVTAYDGIKAALEGTGVEVTYSPGCYGHRYLPLLDGFIYASNGKQGFDISFFNSDPHFNGVTPVQSYITPTTKFRINDHKPQGLAESFYLVGSGTMTFDEDGVYEFGLIAVGKCRLFVDGDLVVDNGYENEQTLGDTFYGLGTREEKGSTSVKAGQKIRIRVEYTNVAGEGEAAHIVTGQPSLMLAALGVGGSYKIEDVHAAIQEAADIAKTCDAVICVTGGNADWETEGSDRTQFLLPGATNELVESLLEVNKDTVVCNISGSAFAFPWVDKASAILQCWLGGNETGNAIADVLFGAVNPSGRISLSFPHEIEHCTAHLNWGSENGSVLYGEGLYVGYRGYEATKREPLFAFGEGLSYTTFDWSDLQVKLTGTSAEDLKLTICITVKNTGSHAGAEVVQFYIHDPVSSLRRPFKELRGFGKIFLQPGEEGRVTCELDRAALSFWDDKVKSWVAEAGEFRIMAARSSRERDVVVMETVSLGESVWWTGV